MSFRKRYLLFGLLGLLLILPGFSNEVVAQESDTSEIFHNLIISLDYKLPSFAPFPQKTGKTGFNLYGETQGLLKNIRAKITETSGWHAKTRYLYFDRQHNRHKIESTRYADFLTTARSYSDAKVRSYWTESLYNSTLKAERDKGAGLVNFKVELPDVGGVLKSIAGEGSAGLNVSGYQKISFSGRSQWTDTESDALNRVSKFPSLDMKQISRYKITGTIGTKITVEVDQNSERKTDLANTIKIRYKGTEDEIIQTIEAGNTNLSLPNTQFVGYSQRVQGLFGIKSTAKIGPLDLTAIISQEKGTTASSSFTAGASQQTNYKREYDYLQRTFFWLFLPQPGKPVVDEIIESEIYVFKQQSTNSNQDLDKQFQWAQVALDPDNFDPTNSEDRLTTVRRLEYDEYYVYNRSQYLEMFTYDRRFLIAGWFKVRYEGSTDTVEIGNKPLNTEDTLQLKLIALEENKADSSYTSFYNEWRNVYSLGARDIDPDGIDVQVFLGPPGTEQRADENLSYEQNSGIPYIQILGLDTRDVTGANNPDGRIDAADNNILIRDRGYLVFPNLTPFDTDVSYAPEGTQLPERVPGIYKLRHNTITRNPTEYTKYYLQFKTEQRQTEYYLGRINIIENSERVVLNGEELKKNRDYRIFYELGQITFLTDKVSDPNADLQIDFEYEPFIASEKKSLFGLRGEYEFNPNFKVGATLLSKGEKSTDRKPRVGQETSKSLVWDTDFSYTTNLPFLTRLTDALPLVEARTASRMSISGEVAQSRPNPNTEGEAYVDDFESTKEAFGLGIIRYQWTLSSSPPETEIRGSLIWYNPYDPYASNDIYNRDVKSSDRKTTLSLKFEPARYREVYNPEDSCNPTLEDSPPDESWAGIMRSFSSGLQNQTNAQLLEIRMKVNNGNLPDKGKLIIDLGDISEDINGNSFLDTEDTNSNGILETFEDVGLDLLADADEPCYDVNSNPDPNGDNFNYDVKNDYSQINGTEGNRFDAGGSRPNTEDLDGKGSLDVENRYFEFVIDFEEESTFGRYLVPGSNLNGWETYRIPIKDPANYTEVNIPDWGQITYGRIWLTAFDTAVLIEIADINLVTTRWKEDSIFPIDVDRNDLATMFSVSVINTEENFNYTSPPGVSGYYDKTTDSYEKEQSLLIQFDSMLVHIDTIEVEDTAGVFYDSVRVRPDTMIAERELFKAEDYAGYQVVKMYVHGPEDLPAEQESNIQFMFRMGRDKNSYYQYQTNLYPGWDPRNEVVIDFNEITPLKDSLKTLRAGDPSITHITVGNYTVKGNPSLTSIIYFAAGVTNTDTSEIPEPLSGEVWLDELRVTDVRDDPGMAMRLSLSGGFSDFISYSLTYKNQDEYFRNLTASNSSNLGSGKKETSYSYSTKVNLHKILPPSWGASLPISFSWSKRESTPRLKPGSDIIIPESQTEAMTTRSTSRSFSISQSFRKQGGNLLFSLLLNRLKASFSYNEAESKSPTVPMSQSERYTVKASYDLSPKKAGTIPIFFWLKSIPLLPKSLSNSQFGYMPSKLTFSGIVNKNYSTSLNSQNYKSITYNRVLKGDMSLRWAIFKAMNFDYSHKTTRDIRDSESLKFSFNPKEILLGIELDNTQSISLSYAPVIFKFLKHNIKYRANYKENADPARNQAGTRNVNNGNTISISPSFSPKTFFGTGQKGRAPQSDSTGGGFAIHKPFLSFIRFFTNRLDDISGTISIDKKYTIWGLQDRPVWKYIIGLDSDPGVPINDTISQGTTRNVNTTSTSYSARSGIKFILGSKIATNYAHTEKESSVRNNKTVGTTFPDLSFSLSNLERYRIIKFFFNTLSLDTKFSEKVDKTYSMATGTEILNSRSTTTNHSPLLKLSFTWFTRLRCNFQLDKSTTLKEQFSTTTDEFGVDITRITNGVRTKQNSWQFSTSASLSSKNGIKLPILGRLRSTLTLNLSISKKNTLAENNQYNDKGWSITSERTDFTVVPRISYSFSSNINGGLSARWQDSNDKTRFQKSHVRELGIWVEIKF